MSENFEIQNDILNGAIPLSAITEESADALCETLGLSISREELLFCKKYYLEKEYSQISLSTLRIFNEISADVGKDPKNICVTTLDTDAREIFDTYVDLARKAAVVSRRESAPLPFADAPDVANEYTKITRKRTQPLLAIRDVYTTEGKPLFPLTDDICSQNVALLNASAFVLVSPAKEISDVEYVSSVEKFITCDGIADKLIRARRVSHGGIITALSEMTSGVLVDFHAIPEMPDAPELSRLVSAHHGKFILALPQSHIEFASAIAEYYGLSIAYFAKVIMGERLVFISSNNISETFDMPLIKKLSHPRIERSMRINEECPTEIGQTPIIKTHGNEHTPLNCGSIHAIGASISSVCAAELGDAPFYASLHTAMRAVLPILACGVERGDVSLKLKYTLRDSTDAEHIGESLAAILGIYRVMSELYLSGESAVEYTDSAAPSVAVAAFADSKHVKAIRRFTREHSGVYLLSFDRDEYGMPRFDSFREMCDFYLECIKNKFVLSAAAVCGSVSESLSDMSSEFECKMADTAQPFLKNRICGIIVESSVPLRHGVFLGSTARILDKI